MRLEFFPPDSAVVRPAVDFNDIVNGMEDGGHIAWDVCNTGLSFNAHGYVGSTVGYVDGDMYSARWCLLGASGVENIRTRSEKYVEIRGLSHRHAVRWDPGVADSRGLAVCYDCLWLISLFRTVMSLSYDWDEVFGWIGHEEGYDRSPGWELRCLPRRLYSPLDVDGDMYSARLCLLGPSGVENIRTRSEKYVDIRRLSHRHAVRWDPGVADSRGLAVCYDCLWLISLFRTVMSLSYDWDEVFVWIGHEEGYDRSPGWELRCLPRRLYSPLVVDGMTQYLTEIKVPGWSLVLNETMNTGARR